MLNYKLVSYQIETDQGLDWVAEFPSLQGVVGTGKDRIEAIKDLYLNAEVHIELMKELNIKLPESDVIQKDAEYSGRITVRTQKSIHAQVVSVSESEGVSINQWINDAITFKLGQYDSMTVIANKVLDLIDGIKDITTANVNLVTTALGKYKADNINNCYVEAPSRTIISFKLNTDSRKSC